MWDSHQLVDHAIRVWICRELYGLRGVENIWGGIWVVLKLEWKPLNQEVPSIKSCRVRSRFEPASSSPSLALVMARRISTSSSVPSPPSSP